MHELLQLSDFSPFLNKEFQIHFTEEVVLPAILIAANELNSYSPADRKSFTLTFRTSQTNEYFPQAIRILQHPKRGELEIFLVPLGPDKEGMRYEAVFN